MRVVVVGGGSAGLFCAHRLADVATVTLVEAGIDPGSPAPDRYLHGHLFPDCDWDYVEADRGYHLVRGRVLGGSSTVNASAGVRGQPHDFTDWGPGWSWDDVLPAFRAIETDEQFGDRPWHGATGPVHVTRLPQGPLDDAFVAACLAAGHPACADHNEPGALGAGPWPTNRVDGGRWGTLAAVAPLVRGRVDVRADSTARRVVVEGGRAVGVEVDGPGGVEVLAADAVVLSCGAFGTPELLWRSGFTAPAIGAGLQDHPWMSMDVFADPGAIAARPVSGGLLRAPIAGDPTDELQVFPFSTHLYDPAADPASYRMSVAIMGPRSRGSIRPTEGGGASRIRLAHLDDDGDLERMVAAARVTGDLLDAMADAGAVTLPPDPWWRSSDLAAVVQARVETYNHPVGTCAIGTVVDERLRFDGVAGLRIADASVMPTIPQANTNLASMMIGWRAGELLAADEGLA